MSDIIPPGAERIEPIEERLPRLLDSSARDLLGAAVEAIDGELGDGYAEKHAGLIAAVLQANALHALADGLDERLLMAAGALGALAQAV